MADLITQEIVNGTTVTRREVDQGDGTYARKVSGGTGGGGGGAVTAANGAFVDGSIVAIGNTTDSAYTGTGAASVIAALKGLWARLPGLGQKTMANSQAVVIASDQSAVPVSVGNFPATQAISIADGSNSAQGATTAAVYTDATGAAAGTANGILKGMFVKLASIVSQLPASLGQKTSANSLAVVVASDQSAIAVSSSDGANAAQGATSATAYSDSTGAAAGTMIGLLKGIFVKLAGILTTGLRADARAGQMYVVSATLGTANTVQSFNVPSGSIGFRLYSASADVVYNINADPAALSTTTAGSAFTFSNSQAGNIALAGSVETRLIDSTAVTLRIASSTASAVVRVGFF